MAYFLIIFHLVFVFKTAFDYFIDTKNFFLVKITFYIYYFLFLYLICMFIINPKPWILIIDIFVIITIFFFKKSYKKSLKDVENLDSYDYFKHYRFLFIIWFSVGLINFNDKYRLGIIYEGSSRDSVICLMCMSVFSSLLYAYLFYSCYKKYGKKSNEI